MKREEATDRPPVPLRKRDVPRFEKGEIRFARIPDARLFINGARASDPRQGNCLDCYLLAALGAVARCRPLLIEKETIRPQEGGDYRVRFFRRVDGKGHEPEWVTIDPSLLVDQEGQPVYARFPPDVLGRREIWPHIAEKAYARWKGGFDVMGEGGLVEDTLEELTGEPSRVLYVARTPPEQLWSLMEEATAKKWPATACTYGLRARPDLEEYGFHPWHIHIFLGCHTWRGRRIVWIRDPFDRPPAGTRNLPDPDGMFTIAWDEFLTYFAEFIVNSSSVRDLPVGPYPAVHVRDALSRSYVFRELPDPLKRRIARDFDQTSLSEGETVFTKGDPPDHYYLIRSGTAEVRVPGPNGRLSRISVLDAGDQFGEMALIDHTVRAAEIRALSDLHLYRLSSRRFKKWILEIPTLAERFRRRFEFQVWMQGWSNTFLSSVSLDGLLAAAQERDLKPFSIVARQGEHASSFYILVSGQCEAYVEQGDGLRKVLKVINPGEVFGEAAILQGGLRGASIRTLTCAKLLEIEINTAMLAMEDFGSLQRRLEFIANQRSRRRTGSVQREGRACEMSPK